MRHLDYKGIGEATQAIASNKKRVGPSGPSWAAFDLSAVSGRSRPSSSRAAFSADRGRPEGGGADAGIPIVPSY